MSEVKVVITLLGILAIILLILLAVCHFMGVWTWTVAWIFSSREEKVGLTRAMGHYNANGYLVRRLLLPVCFHMVHGSSQEIAHLSWNPKVHYGLHKSMRLKPMRVYPKVSGLAAWRENCKWCSSLPLDAVVSLFCESF
jgi:hypothetical protein